MTFAETQLHRSSRNDAFFARETSFTISVHLHGHENTKLSPRRYRPSSLPLSHRWDKSMLHEFTADESLGRFMK